MPVYLDKGTISIRVTEIILPSILNDCNRTLGGTIRVTVSLQGTNHGDHLGILSPLRLPISPPGQYGMDFITTLLLEAGVGIEPAYTELQSAA